MRDGVRLATECYLPAADGRFPVAMVRSIYGAAHQHGRVDGWLRAGYAVVLQNVRGRLESEGRLNGPDHTPQDGYDTLSWLERQTWCDGRVGTFGPSALAAAQVHTAFLAHPAHRAMAPQVLPYQFLRTFGGAVPFAWIAQWLHITQCGRATRSYEDVDWMDRLKRLPIARVLSAPGEPEALYREILEHAVTAYFDGPGPEAFRGLRTPALFTTGWFDNCSSGTVGFYRLVQQHGAPEVRAHTHLVIGPWDHMCGPGEWPGFDVGPEGVRDLAASEEQFFDRHVRGDTRVPMLPPVTYFVMGRNAWRTAREWPPARAVATRLYLQGAEGGVGRGRLLPRMPEGGGPSRFSYDPMDPVPTVGGANNFGARYLPAGVGPRDQRPVLERADVRTFVSDPMREPMEVTGHVRVMLHVSSSARDTDFTAKLMDMRPDGSAMLLTDGIIRAQHRHGDGVPVLLTPGEAVQLEIDLALISYEFQPGHRIGLAISSSNFPRFDRNLNTGGDPIHADTGVVADQAVYHDPARPSFLLIPVMRGDATAQLLLRRER